MFVYKNYFRQHNDGNEIEDYKEFYKKFSNDREFGGEHTHRDRLIRHRFVDTFGHIYNAIIRRDPKNILDIACGNGSNLLFSHTFPRIDYHGIDYADKTVAVAQKDHPRATIERMSQGKQ